MADEDSVQAARIDELERKVQTLEAERALGRQADAYLERALRERVSLDEALARILPLLGTHLGARAAIVRTFDEQLQMRPFAWGPGAEALETAVERAAGARFVSEKGGVTWLGLPIDVAGEPFGAAVVVIDEALGPEEGERRLSLLDVFCETLDNYLAAIAHARLKQRVTHAISSALTEAVLDVGVSLALEVLRENVAFDDLVLLFHQEKDRAAETLQYRVMKRGKMTHDSSSPDDTELDAWLRAHVHDVMNADDATLPERLGIARGFEELLIHGIHDRRVVGRLVVGRHGRAFSTFDHDFLERFADYLRQRIVDFNREWKALSLCFPAHVVGRLLRTPDYVERYLRPREQDVAIMFTDIAGFTRLSEQVLREPRRIGELIDEWGARAVDIVWETGGVFDKMVGDCVIGLWGPPFFEMDPKTATGKAVEAARRIRDMTREIGSREGISVPIGVSTGVSYAPLFVGLFGPDEDYTGFSSGMNNTARLQGVAVRDEILCMESLVEVHGEPERFGELRTAEVKNVAEPLRFRAVE